MKYRLALSLGLMLLITVAISAAERQPSLLFCSPQGLAWGWIDRLYLTELEARGFAVDYTDSLSEVTAERIRTYNAIVLYQMPAGADAAERIDSYVRDGGGVLLFPSEHNIKKQIFHDLTPGWGARLPVEIITENDAAKVGQLSQASRVIPLAYTDDVPPSPVGEGVRGVWYPTAHSYNAQHTGPIAVDDNWQVVLRASATATTAPLDLSKSADPELLDAFSRPGGVTAPALFAIRPLGAGRVALVNQWRQYSVGSGVKWIYNREILSRGVNGKPSDFGRLLENTFRWLAEPSLASGAVGGFEGDKDTLTAPNLRPAARRDFEYTFGYWETEVMQWHRPPKYAPVFRGLIGAKSAHSSGAGSAADYYQAARDAGLDFIVFLEDFEELSRERWQALIADCKKLSDDTVALIPGYRIESNIGNYLFFFGRNPAYPPDYCLTGAKHQLFDQQPQNEDGSFHGYNGPWFNWILQFAHGGQQVGYYNFSRKPDLMQLSDLRGFAMAGLRYYRHGTLVEDVTEDYLLTAQGTLGPSPAAINEVFSPAELRQEAAGGNALTFAQARGLATILDDALRWTSQYDGLNVFPSDGPIIRAWPFLFRVMTLGAENFVNTNATMAAQISVTAAKGLAEIEIWDGAELYRRIALHGEQAYEQTLVLEGIVHKNLVLIVRDMAGGTAVSSTRRCWKSGGRQIVFCGDHVNDCKSGGMLLGRGPNPMIVHWVMPFHADLSGYTWDGGPPAAMPLIVLQESRPFLRSKQGEEEGSRFTQTPLSEFSDGGAIAATTRQERLFADSVERVINPWHTFGPLGGASKLMSFELSYREWYAATVAVPEAGWPGPGVRQGANACLFRSRLQFKQDLDIEQLLLLRNSHEPVVGPAMLVIGSADGAVLDECELTERRETRSWVLQPGAWFGLYSPKVASSHLFVNRLQPVQLNVRPGGGSWLDVRATYDRVDAGTAQTWELFSTGIPMDVEINSVDGLTKRVAYLSAPAGLDLRRGTRLDSPGLLDCAPADHAVELAVPRPPANLALTLPLRVNGLNRRWSTGLWQYAGYVKGDYGTGENRWRPLGLDADGSAYVPLYVDRAELTHVLAGQPIVADEAGRELFIQVTLVFEQPHQWHVSANNPTEQPVTAVLHRTMDLPGLVFPPQVLTLAPGEYRVLR